MSSTGKIITRCRQNGEQVEVFGRLQPEAEEALLFRKPGILKRFDEKSVVLEDFSGLEEVYDVDGKSDFFSEDIFDSLRKGDKRAIGEVFFVVLVVLLGVVLRLRLS